MKINPLILGGGQEFGIRSGTENVFGIISFQLCAEKMFNDVERNFVLVQNMREDLLLKLKELNVDVIVHGEGVPHTMNVCLSKKVRGETLVHALERRNVFVSTGSACSSTKNYNLTLEAMGINVDEILSSIRISFSPYMDFDADKVAKIIKEELEKLEIKSYE